MTPHEIWIVEETLTAAVAVIESYEDREDFLTRLRLRTLLVQLDNAIDLVKYAQFELARTEAENDSRHPA